MDDTQFPTDQQASAPPARPISEADLPAIVEQERRKHGIPNTAEGSPKDQLPRLACAPESREPDREPERDSDASPVEPQRHPEEPAGPTEHVPLRPSEQPATDREPLAPPVRSGKGREKPPSTLEMALHYASLGWRVVPVWRPRNGVCSCRKRGQCKRPGKHPRTRHGWEAATTDRAKIRKWKWQSANIGIATGQESGLLVIDVDPRNRGVESIKELQRKLGKLPPGPRVQTGGGGWHVYLRHPPGPVRKTSGMRGIDIKTDGGVIVAPPSAHVTGGAYRWIRTPDQTGIPEVPEPWLKWLTADCYTSGASDTSYSSNPSNPPDALTARPPPPRESLSLEEVVGRAIEKTAPGNIGRRRNRLFHFLKLLKRHPMLKDKPVQAIRSYVQAWHRRAYPNIRTKPFVDTWQDAVGAWERVDDREGLIERIYRHTGTDPLPKVIQDKDYQDDPIVVNLVVLCRALQHHHGTEPFFLSYRQAAETVGTDAMTAMRCMKMMEADEVIQLLRKGSHMEGLANEYRYLGD